MVMCMSKESVLDLVVVESVSRREISPMLSVDHEAIPRRLDYAKGSETRTCSRDY
jgi:hypothetical protein